MSLARQKNRVYKKGREQNVEARDKMQSASFRCALQRSNDTTQNILSKDGELR